MSTSYPIRGHVYAIRAGDTGRVKIGIAQDVKRRLVDLQRTEAETLRVVASVEASTAHERELHRVLADSQLGGEWFNLDLSDEEITDLLNQPSYGVRSVAADSVAVNRFPLSEVLDSCIEAQERVCDRDSSVDAWTVLAHLRVMREDLCVESIEQPEREEAVA